VEGLVLQETKDWVSEFQSTTGQLEKDVKSQFDDLKAKVETAAKAQADATQPGSLELTVPNAGKADNSTFQALVENEKGEAAKASVNNSQKWVQLNLLPGQYKISLAAEAGGKPVATSTAFAIKAGATTAVSLDLPI